MVELNFESADRKGRAAGVASDGSFNPTRAAAEVCMQYLPESAYVVEYDDLPGSAAGMFRQAGSGASVLRSFKLTMSIAELEDAVQQLDTKLTEQATERADQAAAEQAYVTKRIAELEAALTAVRTVLAPLAGDQWRAFAALQSEFKRTAGTVEHELAELRSRKPARASGGSISELRRILAAELKRLVDERTTADREAVERLRRLGYGV